MSSFPKHCFTCLHSERSSLHKCSKNPFFSKHREKKCLFCKIFISVHTRPEAATNTCVCISSFVHSPPDPALYAHAGDRHNEQCIHSQLRLHSLSLYYFLTHSLTHTHSKTHTEEHSLKHTYIQRKQPRPSLRIQSIVSLAASHIVLMMTTCPWQLSLSLSLTHQHTHSHTHAQLHAVLDSDLSNISASLSR